MECVYLHTNYRFLLDIQMNHGEQKLYLNRHIVRAYEEAKNFLQPLMI